MGRPLGIADLRIDAAAGAVGFDVSRADHWYWCRKHERAEHVSVRGDECVRIGPFMLESEANRCMGQNTYWEKPLGMEVEQ